MLGDFPTHDRFVRDLIFDCKFTAIFVNYPRSTETQRHLEAIRRVVTATVG
jgi:acetyl esterase